jgi:hypothetical protein
VLPKRLARGLIFALCLLAPFSMIPAFKALGMIQIRDEGTITQSCYGYGYESCTSTISTANTATSATSSSMNTATSATTVSPQLSTSAASTSFSTTTVSPQLSTSAGNAPKCVIATAAYGSELAGPVQFLRGFRDGEVNETYLGRSFLTAFNAWYYSWAPSVAKAEYVNGYLRGAVRITILPLLGTLMIASSVFKLIYPMNPELAVLATGLVASSLLGLIYLTPLVFAIAEEKKLRLTKQSLLFAALLGFMLTIVGTLGHGTFGMTEILTSLLVVEIAILTPLAVVRILRYENLQSTRTAAA